MFILAPSYTSLNVLGSFMSLHSQNHSSSSLETRVIYPTSGIGAVRNPHH